MDARRADVQGGSFLARGRLEEARRHSRVVRVQRLALPISAASIVAFYALTFGISWKVSSGRLNVGELRVSTDDLMMKGPSYFGVTKDGGRYEVRAKRAVVAFNRDAPIKLIDIDGDLVQTNNVVTKLKAKHGLFDNAKSELELFDGIDINGSNGLRAKLSRAMVYTKEHRIVSEHPVDVLMPTGTVRGDTMTMHTDTKEATFVGDVKVHLLPAQQQANGSGAVTPAFGRDSRQPLYVASDQLYVNDTTKTSIFTGSVAAVQGNSTLRAPEMHVAYEGKAAAEMATSAPHQPGEGSRLSKLVAKRGAVVTIGTDRRVVGDEAEFDAKADTALFTGNVVVTQLKNVLQGRRLFVDRKAGKSRLEFSRGPGPAHRPHRCHLLSGRELGGCAAQAEFGNRGHRPGRPGQLFRFYQDRSQRPNRGGSRHARHGRSSQTGHLPRQRQIPAGRLRGAHLRDGRFLYRPGWLYVGGQGR